MNEIFLKLKNLNWLYFFLVSFLSFVGIVMIYSATSAMEISIFLNHITKVFFGLTIISLGYLIRFYRWRVFLSAINIKPPIKKEIPINIIEKIYMIL